MKVNSDALFSFEMFSIGLIYIFFFLLLGKKFWNGMDGDIMIPSSSSIRKVMLSWLGKGNSVLLSYVLYFLFFPMKNFKHK